MCQCDSFLDNHIDRNHVRFLKHIGLKTPHNSNRNNFRNDGAGIILTASAADSVNIASLKAILKLVSTCGIGAYATKHGMLDKQALSVLSKLVFNIFQPCLLFVNVAQTISNAGAPMDSTLFILPIAAAFQIFLGFFLGKLLTWIFYGNVQHSDDKNQLLACTTFANSGPLPLVFTDSLFRNHKDPTLLSKSVAYISMYLLMWSPLFWALGSSILSPDESSLSRAERNKQLLSRILSPPIIACLAGLVVGLVPTLRTLWLSPAGLLNPVLEALRTLSSAYLPAVLLVLAGSLMPSEDLDPLDTDLNIHQVVKPLGFDFAKRVAAVYVSRFLLMPFVAFFVIGLIKRFFPFGATLLADPLLLFILLLEACMPSAQNSTVILQLQGNQSAAASMARTLVAVYVLGVPAMSFWLAKILSVTKLM